MARSGKYLYYCVDGGTKYCVPLYNNTDCFSCVSTLVGCIKICDGSSIHYLPYSRDTSTSDTTYLRYNDYYVQNKIFIPGYSYVMITGKWKDSFTDYSQAWVNPPKCVTPVGSYEITPFSVKYGYSCLHLNTITCTTTIVTPHTHIDWLCVDYGKGFCSLRCPDLEITPKLCQCFDYAWTGQYY